MKKSLNNILTKYNSRVDDGLTNEEDIIKHVPDDEAMAIRGGDKEYKPIYEDGPKEYHRRTSLFSNLF